MDFLDVCVTVPVICCYCFVTLQNPISIPLTLHLDVTSRHMKFQNNRSFPQAWFAMVLPFRMALNCYHIFIISVFFLCFFVTVLSKTKVCILLPCIGSYFFCDQYEIISFLILSILVHLYLFVKGSATILYIFFSYFVYILPTSKVQKTRCKRACKRIFDLLTNTKHE